MDALELDKLQKEISAKILDLVKRECGCPKVAEKLKVLEANLDSLNRAAYYLMKVPPTV